MLPCVGGEIFLFFVCHWSSNEEFVDLFSTTGLYTVSVKKKKTFFSGTIWRFFVGEMSGNFVQISGLNRRDFAVERSEISARNLLFTDEKSKVKFYQIFKSR